MYNSIRKTEKHTKQKGLNMKTISESDFQTKCSEFVKREVLCCQSSLVEELLSKEIFSYDDIQNIYPTFDEEEIEAGVECPSCTQVVSKTDSVTGQCEDCFEDEKEPQEVFEWWAVSGWLSEKLMEAGEPILENEHGVWWGRTTTGQAIMIDGVIRGLVKRFWEASPEEALEKPITAAPDLLEALEGLVKELEPQWPIENAYLADAFCCAKEVIKKAKGE